MAPKRSRTSLESQLSKLHAPQTDSARTTKLRTSFLYTPSAAAGIDTDTHYANTRAAFDSMLQIDTGIEAFGESLFGAKSKELDRSTLSKQAAEELNAEIARFLMDYVCPYFSLSSMHKLLEWLVYKYEIVSYNWTDLLTATLPYHQTLLFVRVVQMCGSKVSKQAADNCWHFVSGLVSSGVPLDRQVIINHCSASQSFFNNLSDKMRFALKTPDNCGIFTNFYVSLLFGIVHSGLDDSNANLIFGALQSGFDATHWPYSVSIYALIGFLASKTPLTAAVMGRIIKRMARQVLKVYSKTEPEATQRFWQTLSIICAHQEIPTLPTGALDLIEVPVIDAISQSTPLLYNIIASLVDSRSTYQSSWTKLESILDQVTLKPVVVSLLINALVAICSSKPSKSERHHISVIVSILQRRYPETFDSVLADKSKLAALTPYIKSIKFGTSDDLNGVSLVDGVTHASRPIRTASYRLLIDQVAKLDLEEGDADPGCRDEIEFIKSAMLRALSDEEPEIVMLLFPLADQSKLTLLVKDDLESEVELQKKLRRLLAKCQTQKALNLEDESHKSSSSWTALEELVLLEIIQSGSAPDDKMQFMLLLLPYLIPSSLDEVKLTCKLLKTQLQHNKYESIQQLYKMYEKSRCKSNCLPVFLERLSDYVATSYSSARGDDFPFLELITANSSKLPIKCSVLAMLCLHKLFSNSDAVDMLPAEQYNHVGLIYMTLIQSFISHPTLKKSRHDKFLDLSVTELSTQCMGANQVNLTLLYNHLSTLINAVKLPILTNTTKSGLDAYWELHNNLAESSFLTPLFDLLHDGQESSHNRVKAAFEALLSQLHNSSARLELLPWSMAYLPCHSNPQRQLRALQIVSRDIVGDEEPQEPINCSLSQLIGLTICFTSPVTEVRAEAVKVLSKLSFPPEMTKMVKILTKNGAKLENGGPDRMPQIALHWADKLVREQEDPTATEWLASMVNLINDSHSLTNGHIRLALLQIISQLDVEVLTHIKTILEDICRKGAENTTSPPLDKTQIETARIMLAQCAHCLQSTSSDDEENADHQEAYQDVLKLLLSALHCPQLAGIVFDLTQSEWFNAIESQSIKMSLLDSYLDLFELDSERSRKLIKAFKRITFDGSLAATFIEDLLASTAATIKRDPDSQDQDEEAAKKSKKCNEPDPRECKRVFLLLEATAESPIQLLHKPKLVTALMKLLRHLTQDSSSSGSDYQRHVLLNLTYRCLEEEETCTAQVVIEPLIACLRDSHSREVKRTVISILSRITTTHKTALLSSVVDIFSYLGDSVRRASNEVTMRTISEILSSIIAPLIAEQPALHDQLIGIFLVQLSKIPVHRRSILFQKLITIKPDCNLTFLVVRMLLRMVAYDAESDGPERLYLNSFILEFIQLQPLKDSLQLISDLSQSFVVILDGDLINSDSVLKHVDVMPHQRAEFIQVSVSLLSDLFGSYQFYTKLTDSSSTDDRDDQDETFELIIRNSFHAVQLLSKRRSSKKRKSALLGISELSERQFYHVINKVNDVLPLDRVLQLITRILETDLADETDASDVRLQILELLNDQLTKNETSSPVGDRNVKLDTLLTLLDPLGQVIKLAGSKSSSSQEQDIKCALKALLALTSISARIRKTSDSRLSEVIIHQEPILRIMFQTNFQLATSSSAAATEFASSTLIAATMMIACMDIHAVPYIPQLMELLIGQLELKDEEHAVSNVTALYSLSSKFASYMGPYLSNVLTHVIRLCAAYGGREDLISPAKNFWRDISRCVSYDALLAALMKTFEEDLDLKQEPEAAYWVGEFGVILFQELPKMDYNTLLTELQSTSTKLMSFRAKVGVRSLSTQDTGSVDRVEQSLLKVILTFVPKLSEITFRPLLYSLFDWADKCPAEPDRLVTFLNLMELLASSLKSLFAQFAAPYITPKMLTVLDENNASDFPRLMNQNKIDTARGHRLILQVFKILTTVCTHDLSGSYLSQDRASSLVKPVADQVSNLLAGSEAYQQRLTDGLVPCVRALVGALKNDTVLKALNHRILVHARSEDFQVRLGCIELLSQGVVAPLAEAFSDLLADSAPTLFELLQDADEAVEKKTNILITQIEQVTGQSMDKYF